MSPTYEEAIAAVRTLIRWGGDNPDREGMKETPDRVVRAYREWFGGYALNPEAILKKTFGEVADYDEIVCLSGIKFESHCEHHMCPIIGKATVAYLPNKRVVGISKLARVVDAYSKRFQIQEKMTQQIADVIAHELEPRGVAVFIQGEHHCMSTRGVHKSGVTMTTSALSGVFKDNPATRAEVMRLAGF